MEMSSTVLSNVSKTVSEIDDSPDLSGVLEPVTLDMVSSGTKAVIVKIDRASPGLYRRLTQLGLVPGTKLKVIRVAPLGCPVQVELRGFCLALRLAEASAVYVSI